MSTSSMGGGKPLGERDPDDILREAAANDSDDAAARAASGASSRAQPASSAAPSDLQRAYANLELTPPSSLDEAKTAWRKLMLQFHPDRFQSDPVKLEKATKVATRLTEAYRIVREHLEKR